MDESAWISSDAVHRTSCRSTDCESSGTKVRNCAVTPCYNLLILTFSVLCFCTRKDSYFQGNILIEFGHFKYYL